MADITTGRRSLMGSGMAMLVLAAAAAGDAKAQELDGDLLRFCTEYHAIQARVAALNEEWSGITNISLAEDRVMSDRVGDDWREQDITLDAIQERPARTPEGLRAKAGVFEAELLEKMDGDSLFVEWRDCIAWSLVQDILGRTA